MAKPSSDARGLAEARFDKARKTTETAQALIDSELAAVRAKTKRLKAARLAKEAGEGVTELDKKKGGKTGKAKKRK
jgi:hypothetical protein